MSIPVLTQVYDEVRRLAIAGSVLASGDFRLKKLVPPLEQAGQKSPVFAKVAQAVNKVVESNDQNSAESLLELSTLVNAILYTQGETSVEGELEPIDAIDLGLQVTQTSARVLKPLLEALTKVGSGRFEIIKDAHERGAFIDLRLIKPAISALDDSYAEIADFVSEQVLPLYGKSILTELRSKFDQKGRGGHARRLSLIHQLDPEGARELVKQALEEGSKEVKVAAIRCLGESPEDLVFLLDQLKSKAKDVREAALTGLARSDSLDAVAALRSALEGSDIEIAVVPVRGSKNPAVLKIVLELAADQLNVLLTGKLKDKNDNAKHAGRFLLLLECLRDRDDKDTEIFFLGCFEKRDKLVAIKGDVSGKDILQKLVSIMSSGSKRSQLAVAEAHATLSDVELIDAFAAARRICPPNKVYESFSPYLKIKSGEKTKKDAATAKQASIIACLTGRFHHSGGFIHHKVEDFQQPLDPRWLDLAVDVKNLELVQSLARPDHPGANKLLSAAFDETLKSAKSVYETTDVLATMIRIGHPNATDTLIAAINKCVKSASSYGLYWLGRLISDLPKESVPKLEALLPTLPESAIDQLHDYVTQLKNKS